MVEIAAFRSQYITDQTMLYFRKPDRQAMSSAEFTNTVLLMMQDRKSLSPSERKAFGDVVKQGMPD